MIPPEDFGSTMSVVDNSFDIPGTQAYRVYAVKNGILSDDLTGSTVFSAGAVEASNMSVKVLNNAFLVQWDAPSTNSRFVVSYNVYKHQSAAQSGLAEGSASLIYSGAETRFMYEVSGTTTDFHQFWVTTTIAS